MVGKSKIIQICQLYALQNLNLKQIQISRKKYWIRFWQKVNHGYLFIL